MPCTQWVKHVVVLGPAGNKARPRAAWHHSESEVTTHRRLPSDLSIRSRAPRRDGAWSGFDVSMIYGGSGVLDRIDACAKFSRRNRDQSRTSFFGFADVRETRRNNCTRCVSERNYGAIISVTLVKVAPCFEDV